MSLSCIILLPLLGAILNGSYALFAAMRKCSVNRVLVNLVGIGLPLAAFATTLCLAWPFLQGREETLRESYFSWISVGSFQVTTGLSLDRLSSVMALIITGVGTMIHLYSAGYMKEDPGYAKYFAYLNLFLTAMLILVLGDNLLLLFLGWEGVGLCSYLLIGFWFEDPAKAAAGKKAFIVNRVGDFGFLLGVFLILYVLFPQADGPTALLSYDYLRQHAALLAPLATAITLCLFVGATGKSAQIPLYVWLPDAMAGPTPVSALIHAATMVTAGVYMIARLDFLFDLAPQTLQVIAVVGGVTALFAASIGLVQNDIKKVLAYSTVSQLGYMFLAMGVGAYQVGVFHLMTHAFFKACLFLGSGSVIHAMGGEQDIRKMGALRKAMPITSLTFLIATLAIAGFPPFAGFFSKDEILWEVFRRGHFGLWVVGMVSAAFTAFYMFRLFALVFLGESRASEHAKAHLHESPWTMTLVLSLLAVLSLVGGWVNIPEILGGHAWWHHWLELGTPFTGESDHHLELLLMIASVAVALVAATTALVVYLKKRSVAEGLSRNLPWLHRLLANKYYVDEFYDAAIIQPIKRSSDAFLSKVVDRKLIDGAFVNGSGRLVAWLGSLESRLQNGLVNQYAFYFLVGVAFFTVWVVWF